MSIDMYLEAARTQAESLGRAVEQCLGQNLKLISVLSAFHNEDELKGKAYDSKIMLSERSSRLFRESFSIRKR